MAGVGGETSAPFKSKPARIKDALRKIWKKPPGRSSYPYKKKPARKGRPD